MDKLDPASLDWVIAHIQRYGDTDIFPIPFEFAAIAHHWLAVRTYLAGLDLSAYVPGPSRRTLVPKPGGGFRVAVQLDPLDSITYTALIYEMANYIEGARVSRDLRVACSFRVQLDAKGSFVAPLSGWKDFHERSQELVAVGNYSHVLIADISDFYNQVYVHRVENALEAAGVSPQRARNVERFLLALNAKQSRGLPVGPFASILLAEAALTDVDNFLLRKGAPHVRYVDDFRIFCTSRQQAISIQHDLTEYLYTAHRLSLETYKTRVIHVARFSREELRDPEQEERDAKTLRLKALVDELRDITGYDVEPDELPEDEKAAAVRESLAELFEAFVAERPLHLGLARHLLRRALALKTAVIQDRVFESMESLAPVLRDVIRYVIGTLSETGAAVRGCELNDFLTESDIGRLPFVRMWGNRQ